MVYMIGTTPLTAHDIAAYPEYYNKVIKIGRTEYECMGYSKTGKSIRFAKIIVIDDFHLRQINRYVKPDTVVEFARSSSR